MFGGAMFREMLLPLPGNVNDYMGHVYSKYADLDGNNRTGGPV